MSVPAASRIRAHSRSPSRAAKCSALNPLFVRACSVGAMVDQQLDHVGMVLGCRPHQRRLTLRRLLRRSPSAPRAMRLRTAPALPVPAHVMIGVSPVAIGVFGFAPAFRRRSTMAALAFVHASDNGVVRRSLAASTSAPARMRRSAVSRSFQCAAQSSAVAPVERPHVHVDALLQQSANGSPDRCCAPHRRDADRHRSGDDSRHQQRESASCEHAGSPTEANQRPGRCGRRHRPMTVRASFSVASIGASRPPLGSDAIGIPASACSRRRPRSP